MLSCASTATHCGVSIGSLPVSRREMNLYFCWLKSKMWIPAAATSVTMMRPARISDHAVGTHQVMEIGLARDHVHHPRPETSLRFDFALQAEAALPRKFSAAIHQQIRRRQRPQRLLRALRRSPRYAYAHPQERGGDEHPCARTRASPPPCVQRSDCRLPGHSTLSCIGIRF